MGSDYLRAEMLGLHFVRERIVSTEYKIRKGGEEVREILTNNIKAKTAI